MLKTGIGSLVFRKTGEVLWNCKIVEGSQKKPIVKNLGIYVDDGNGNDFVLDGSKNSPSLLETPVRDIGRSLRDLWPDGTTREMTFMYSACGCPVK